MAERGSRKIPVTERQFLWVQDDDKGEVVLHVGPTMVSPTAADRVVINDGQGGFGEDPRGEPQPMIELSDAEYAVLYNPLVENEEAQPNGRFKQGRNEGRPLRNGTRAMIPGPCSFYLRPGQRVEVRDAHELASNQYLVVKVYGDVDLGAPYYQITAKSAAITTATAEDVTGDSSTSLADIEPVPLTRGQLIVIRGLDTQFYIPPSGVDVVPDLSVDGTGATLSAATARQILRSTPQKAPATPNMAVNAAPLPAQALVEAMDIDDDLADEVLAEFEESEYPHEEERSRRRLRKKERAEAPRQQGRLQMAQVEQAARLRHQVQRPAGAVAKADVDDAREQKISRDEMMALLASDVHRQALEREVRKARLVRQAVVLSEKEFCVILDADGKRQIKRGPARVFPGPYDSFQTRGSRERIYVAYELLPQRALWLRFIAPIVKDKLAQLTPRGIELDQDIYQPGDELIVTGVNSFFFPFNEIEILHPLTGQPHVGNDHTDIFIEAIGIDQRSGIYVRDLTTGEARLVRGKRSYLVDPRKEVHITRTVPPDEWNLWIANGEPHKLTGDAVTTPWAISVTVPHNTAVLCTSADGQRVIEGPCVELLEYEEALAPLTLSTGTPKTDARTVRTCFLRTAGNRVSDVITMETSDFVEINAKVSYHVTFDGDHRERWFDHENYVGLLCDHLRSLVRGQARLMSLEKLWPNLSTVIRDIILGERTEAGRKGRAFSENGMRVTEVEVLSGEVLDKEIAQLLEHVQRESVALVIGDQQAHEKLRSQKLRHQLEQERLTLEREARQAKAQLEALQRELEQTAKLAELRGGAAHARESLELTAQREALAQAAELERQARATEAEAARLRDETTATVEAARLRHAEKQSHEQVLTAIQIQRIEAESKAVVAERQAVQPALVEALTGLGDKFLLGEVAENMNLVSLFRGRDVATIFADVVGGTKLGRTIEKMLPERSGSGESRPAE